MLQMKYTKEIPISADSKDLKYISNELENFKTEFQKLFNVLDTSNYEIRIKQKENNIVFTIIEI